MKRIYWHVSHLDWLKLEWPDLWGQVLKESSVVGVDKLIIMILWGWFPDLCECTDKIII